MAVTVLTTTMSAGINYKHRVDNSSDWSSLSNNTYFYNIEDRQVYYKNPSGDVLSIFTSAGVTGSGTTNYIPRWTGIDTLSSTGSIYDDGSQVTIGTLTASNTGNILEVSGNVGVYKVSSYINLGLSPTFETQYESTSNTGIEIGSVLTTRPNLSGTNTGYQIGGAGILYWDDTNNSTNQQGLMGMVGEVFINSSSTNITGAVGVASVLVNQSTGGTVSNMYGFRPFWNSFVTHNGWTDNYYGFYMSSPDADNLNIGNKYGVYINDTVAHNILLGPVGLGGITSPNYELEVSGTVSTTAFRMTNGASSGYILQSDASGNATWVLPTDNAGVTGSGTTNYIPRWTATDTLSSTGSVYDDGTNVGIGTTSLTQAKLEVRNISTLTDTRGIKVQVNNGTRNLGYISQIGSVYAAQTDDIAYHSYIGSGYTGALSIYGIRNDVLGTGLQKNGTYNNISGNGLSTNNIGTYNIISGANNFNYGSIAQISGTYGVEKWGFHSTITGSNGINTRNTGVFSSSNGGVINYGLYGNAGGGSSNINADVGVFGRVSGVLTSSQSTTYAGYFTNGDDRFGSSSYGISSTVQTNSLNAYGADISVSGSNTTSYGSRISVFGATTSYGLYINSQGISNSYALVTISGQSIFNEGGGDHDFRVEGDTDPNVFFIDASTNNVGIGNNLPDYKLKVSGTVSSTTGFNTNGLNGWSGTFSADGQIVTVTGGIITSVV